jgi:hypothetical protein
VGCAHEAGAERFFSTEGDIINKKRRRLNKDSVLAQVILRMWLHIMAAQSTNTPSGDP